MSQYRSARGKVVDMAAMVSRNERTPAVGNMKVNARGDTIDSQGNIITPVSKKASDAYQKTVGNRAANIIKSNQDRIIPDKVSPPVNHSPPAEVQQEPIAILEEEFDSEFIKEEKPAFVIKPASEAPLYVKPEPSKTETKRARPTND
jgi:hypothetical protein